MIMQNPNRILLAGSTGYIGGAIARRWAVLGLGRLGEVYVRGLVRRLDSQKADELRAAGVDLFQADLARPETLSNLAGDIRLVVHAAGGRSPAQTALSLYQAVQAAGADRFIYISTMDIYADEPGNIEETREVSYTGQRTADAHLAAEQVLREHASRPGCPELTILRLGPVYGPNAQRWTRRPLDQARKGSLSIPGAGDFPWIYLYVDNMVDAVTAAATSSAAGVYNIFDGTTTYAGFMRAYAAMVGRRLMHSPAFLARVRASARGFLETRLGMQPDLTSDALRVSRQLMPGRIYQAEKAAQELGWLPRISLEEGMEIIQRSNGYRPSDQRDPDPWKENDEWSES